MVTFEWSGEAGGCPYTLRKYLACDHGRARECDLGRSVPGRAATSFDACVLAATMGLVANCGDVGWPAVGATRNSLQGLVRAGPRPACGAHLFTGGLVTVWL